MTSLNETPTRVTDSFGRPIAYARVYFYQTGTSTLLEVWADLAMATPRTNPVICGGPENPGMLPAVFLDPSEIYRIDYCDQDDVLVFSVDGVSGAAIARQPIDHFNQANYAYDAGDVGRVISRTYTSAMTDTLSAAASMGNGYVVTVWNDSPSYADTISVSGGGSINGLSTLVLQPGEKVTLYSDGTGYFSARAPILQGYHDISIPAAGMVARPTNPATYREKAYATNNIALAQWVFSSTPEQGVNFAYRLPRSWDSGSIQWSVSWGSDSGVVGQTIRWGVKSRVIGNAELLDAAYGTQATHDTTQPPGASLGVTGWDFMAPAGLAGDNGGKLLILEVSRPVFGTLAGPAFLQEITLRLGINRGVDG